MARLRAVRRARGEQDVRPHRADRPANLKGTRAPAGPCGKGGRAAPSAAERAPDLGPSPKCHCASRARHAALNRAEQKIALSNPYGNERLFRLHSSRPDLLGFKEAQLAVPVGESRYIGLALSADPTLTPGVAEVLVLVNNHEEKNEECMLVRVAFVRDAEGGGALAQPSAGIPSRLGGQMLDA